MSGFKSLPGGVADVVVGSAADLAGKDGGGGDEFVPLRLSECGKVGLANLVGDDAADDAGIEIVAGAHGADYAGRLYGIIFA